MNKKGLLIIPAIAAMGIGSMVLLGTLNHDDEIFYGYASSNRVLEITALDIANAIGAGTSGNFVVGGLEWHVDNASSDGSTANIHGGVLYNVTFAGTSVNASGYRGNGFSLVEIIDMSSATGAYLSAQNKAGAQIDGHAIGAVTESQYSVDLSSDNAKQMVSRVHLAFGAGDGTSFSSIRYTYSCVEAVPTAVLTTSNSSIAVSGTTQITANFTDVAEPYPSLHTFTSSDESVATVSETGLVTGVSGGTTTISAKFTYNAVVYNAVSIDITVTEGPVVPKVSWYTNGTGNRRNHIDGAGMWTWINITDLGYSNYDDINTKSVKDAIVLDFDSTSIRFDTFSDAFTESGNTIVRMYLVMGAAVSSGKLEVQIPNKSGTLIEGSITFDGNEATSYNS